MADRALELRPNALNALFWRGQIEIARGRRSQAIECVNTLRQLGYSGLARELEAKLRRAADSKDL